MVTRPPVRSAPLSRSVMPSARVRLPGPLASRAAGTAAATPGHRRETVDRLQGADEHAAGLARGAGDRVEAVVDAVVQVDVGEAAVAVEEGVAAGPERGVRGGVLWAQVRLGLDDAAGGDRAAAS